MRAVEELERHLEEGRVYRREELMQWSHAVDRHLILLQKKKVLMKLSGGLYYKPQKTIFGPLPIHENDLIRAFLKDERFLVMSPNLYNSLNIGSTQLYNKTYVYNRKRHGKLTLGGRDFFFKRVDHFPNKVSFEFLLVDLMNNLKTLAEDQNQLLLNIESKITSLNESQKENLANNVKHYGGIRTRKFFARLLNDRGLLYGS